MFETPLEKLCVYLNFLALRRGSQPTFGEQLEEVEVIKKVSLTIPDQPAFHISLINFCPSGDLMDLVKAQILGG